MGNYGNTLDRWYRRAAVVVWPRDRAFAARAEAGSQWALSELRTRIEAGDLEGARAAAESLAPFWKTIGSQAGLLDTALHVAAGLGAAGTAAMLLEPFRVETVAPEHAGGLAAGRAIRRGVDARGHRRVVRAEEHHSEPTGTSGSRGCRGCAGRCMPPGCRKWRGCWPPAPGAGWATSCCSGPPPRGPRFASHSWRCWARRWCGCWRRPTSELRDEIVAALRGYGDTVLGCLMPALRSAAALPTAARRAGGLDAVARDCAKRLGAIIARPLRDEDDWSIAWTGCGCHLCDALGTFLGSQSRRLGVAAGQGRAAARAHPDRLGRATGAAQDPAAGAALHARTDEDRRAVHAPEGRAAQGRDRPDVAEVGVG